MAGSGTADAYSTRSKPCAAVKNALPQVVLPLIWNSSGRYRTLVPGPLVPPINLAPCGLMSAAPVITTGPVTLDNTPSLGIPSTVKVASILFKLSSLLYTNCPVSLLQKNISGENIIQIIELFRYDRCGTGWRGHSACDQNAERKFLNVSGHFLYLTGLKFDQNLLTHGLFSRSTGNFNRSLLPPTPPFPPIARRAIPAG